MKNKYYLNGSVIFQLTDPASGKCERVFDDGSTDLPSEMAESDLAGFACVESPYDLYDACLRMDAYEQREATESIYQDAEEQFNELGI